MSTTSIVAIFDDNINLAQGKLGEQERAKAYTVTSEQASWVTDETTIELEDQTTPNGQPYFWGDMTHASNSILKYLPDETDLARLISAVQNHVGAFIDERRSSSLRKEEWIDTSFLAYKDDNLSNNNFRALVLRGQYDEKEMFLLAALFHHNSQAKVLGPLMNRQYRN